MWPAPPTPLAAAATSGVGGGDSCVANIPRVSTHGYSSLTLSGLVSIKNKVALNPSPQKED